MPAPHSARCWRDAYEASDPDPTSYRRETEAARFTRAPIVVAVVSRIIDQKSVPEWEQILSAGAACQNLLVAANAAGYSGQWITEWYAFDETVCRSIGLEEGERIAGFVYIGTAKEPPKERDRPDLDAIVSYWRPQ